MTSIINPKTFEASEIQPEHGYWIDGTVEVTLHHETRRVEAIQDKEGRITAYGMRGRYQTGAVSWPASARRVIDPTTGNAWDQIRFGRDDRAAKFKKTGNLFFSNGNDK